jgi:hypothetical protein
MIESWKRRVLRFRRYVRGIPWGRTHKLDADRTLVCDLLHFAKQVPSIPVQRRMNVGPLQESRNAAQPRISWCVLFTKGLALVTAETPELRRAYLSFPARIYEHPKSVASISVERMRGGKRRLAFARLTRPEGRSLAGLDRYLKRFATSDAEMGVARLVRASARLWRPLRLAIWWLGLNVSGTFRGRRLGTFGVSVYSSLGAESLHPIGPLAYVLNYGVIRPDGEVDVRLIYDHRIVDGATVARALDALEKKLNGAIKIELDALRSNVRLLEPAIA